MGVGSKFKLICFEFFFGRRITLLQHPGKDFPSHIGKSSDSHNHCKTIVPLVSRVIRRGVIGSIRHWLIGPMTVVCVVVITVYQTLVCLLGVAFPCICPVGGGFLEQKKKSQLLCLVAFFSDVIVR